jgi:hypothetical protein
MDNHDQVCEGVVGSNLQPEHGDRIPSPQSIIDIIHIFISTERLRSFKFLAKHSHKHMKQDDLLVVSRAECTEVDKVLENNCEGYLSDYKVDSWFTLKEHKRSNSIVHTVVITAPQGQVPNIDNLTITIPEDEWGPRSTAATTWLREIYDWDDEYALKFPETQYEEQRYWWKGISKSFDLFRLPAELREMIYLEMLGPIVLPYVHHEKLLLSGLSFKDTKRDGKNLDPDIEPPNMTIMRVSKRVRDEATHVAHKDTFKRLHMTSNLPISTAAKKPSHYVAPTIPELVTLAPDPRFLQRIQLEMNADIAFKSIGIEPLIGDPSRQPVTAFALRDLRQCKSLQYLDFRFMGPKNPDAVCPWAHARDTHQLCEHACQKKWIESFFIFAFDTLKTLSPPEAKVRFSLSGCVKTSTKTYWEDVLNDKSDKHTRIIRQAAEKILAEGYGSDPFVCECSTPCSKAGALAEGVYVWEEYEVENIKGLQEMLDEQYWDFRD